MSFVPMLSQSVFPFEYTITSISFAHISMFRLHLPSTFPRLDACFTLPVNHITVADGTFLAVIPVTVVITVSSFNVLSQLLFNAPTD